LTSQTRVVWITNLAPPYRRPVWDAIARTANLQVWLLENGRKLLKDTSNRGSDWVPDVESKYKIRELPTFRIKRGEARHYVTWWFPSRALRSADAVVIGGWDSPAYWAASFAAKRGGVRRVGFYESHTLSRTHTRGLIHRLRIRFFQGMDAIVVPGIAARNALLADGIDPEKIWVGFNSVDGLEIARKTEAYRSQPISPSPLRLLYVGQLIVRKNVASVLEGMKLASAIPLTLTVVGTGPDLSKLKALAAELNIADRVLFVGYVANADLPELYAKHDVLVMPSTEEVWGLVVNEALAGGLLSIVSAVAGVAPSVVGMKGVYVVVPEPEGIALAFHQVMRDFKGPIHQPEILAKTPEAFGQVFMNALGMATVLTNSSS